MIRTLNLCWTLYNQAKRKVANIHQKVARQRKDFLHKSSHRIIQGHDLIVVRAAESEEHAPTAGCPKASRMPDGERSLRICRIKRQDRGSDSYKCPPTAHCKPAYAVRMFPKH
ncbi:transposase [Paenibacillus jiagnxiensis]|uniref:transposase n=1 Tax=Paenibacillus jiagnxiensis TaxID=3228926 RepID=UPI0033B35C77